MVSNIEHVGGSGHQYGKMLMVVVYAGGSAIHRRGYRHAEVDEANEHTNVVVSSLLAQCSDHRGGICRSESTSSADEESAGVGVDDQQAGQKRAQARGIPERD